MAKAKTDFTPVEIKELDFNLRRGKKVMEGGCNMCVDRDYEEVNVIEMRSLSFRLCDKCKKMLKKIL
jgi:hypothetical protein